MIDTKLIKAHQWVVDVTEKKPGWWAENSIMAATAFDLVRNVLTWDSGWDAVILLLCLVCCTGLVYAARNEVLLKAAGDSKWIRGFFVGVVAFQVFTLFVNNHIAIDILDVLSATLMLSYYCFAACQGPRPRKRKEKLVLQPA